MDTYEDIYLDTTSFDLYKKGYSLRFRKRTLVNNEISYRLQLKSEMTEISSIRMEVDEPELDFYKIKSNNTWIPLTTNLDQLFKHLDEKNNHTPSRETQTAIDLLNEWVRFKSTAPITPFP